jgi:hypothetical protein
VVDFNAIPRLKKRRGSKQDNHLNYKPNSVIEMANYEKNVHYTTDIDDVLLL